MCRWLASGSVMSSAYANTLSTHPSWRGMPLKVTNFRICDSLRIDTRELPTVAESGNVELHLLSQ